MLYIRYKHIDKLSRNAQYKLHARWRIRKYLSLVKAKMLGNTSIDIHFSYALSQPAIKYSKLTRETLEQGVKYVQS